SPLQSQRIKTVDRISVSVGSCMNVLRTPGPTVANPPAFTSLCGIIHHSNKPPHHCPASTRRSVAPGCTELHQVPPIFLPLVRCWTLDWTLDVQLRFRHRPPAPDPRHSAAFRTKPHHSA